MEDGIEDLEKEVICLRELLSHLKIEEGILTKGQREPTFLKNRDLLQKERLKLQKRRKQLLLTKVIQAHQPEVITFLEQIASLKDKIEKQRKINLELKKQFPYPLQKNEPIRKVKKKTLLLEDQNA